MQRSLKKLLVKLCPFKIANNRFLYASVATSLVIFLVGMFTLFSNDYESTCSIVRQRSAPKVKSSISKLLSSFSQSGIDIGTVAEFEPIEAELYSLVINRKDFIKDLMYSEFHFIGEDSLSTLYDYILKNNRISFVLFSKSIEYNLFEDNVYLMNVGFTQEEAFCASYIQKHLSYTYLPKSSVSLVSFRMPDQNAVAEITYRIVDILQEYLENMRKEYAEYGYQYAQTQKERSDSIHNEASLALARYQDSHHAVVLLLADVEREMLSANSTFTENWLTQTSKYYMNAYINLMEDLPPVVVVSRPTIPNSKNHISLFSLIFLSIIGGVTIGSLFIKSKK